MIRHYKPKYEDEEGREERDTCSLCLGTYRDPVSLPCDHSFCRGCIKSLLLKSLLSTGEDTSSDPVDISCTLCGTNIKLGLGDIDQLPSRHDNKGLGIKLENTEGPTDTLPLCDMCEGDKNRAEKYCEKCMVLYCGLCVELFHPQRGPLVRHKLLPMKDYISQGGVDQPDGPKCADHEEPLSLFCASCEHPICNSCLSGHDDHMMNAIASAFDKKKALMQPKIQLCQEMVANCKELQTQLVRFREDVQSKRGRLYEGIESMYLERLKAIQEWRKSERGRADQSCDRLTRQTSFSLKTLSERVVEMSDIVTAGSQLLSCHEAEFLQKFAATQSRIEDITAQADRENENLAGKIDEQRSTLDNCSFLPCKLETPDYNLQVLQLKFVKSSSASAVIEDNGMVVRSLSQHNDVETIVYTDGKLTGGTLFWEMEISWNDQRFCGFGFSAPSRPKEIICTSGVVNIKADSKRTKRIKGDDDLLWAVRLFQKKLNSSRPICCECMHKGKVECESTLLGKITGQGDEHRVRLGFLLNGASRTLTLIDLDKKSSLHTFREVNLSAPLLPFVQFGQRSAATADGFIFEQPTAAVQSMFTIASQQPSAFTFGTGTKRDNSTSLLVSLNKATPDLSWLETFI